MNEPRCDSKSGPDGGRCLNQASGYWLLHSRRIALCDDDRRELADQGLTIRWDEWEPLHPHPVQAAIDRRVELMRQGAFG